MPFLCECRGPCRRRLDLSLNTYTELRRHGAVIDPECAERERRKVLAVGEGAVAAATYGWRQKRHRVLSVGFAIKP